ncbi:MAG: UDP-3-O-acyl-N-acetylglucosamine deacetylase [Phycisphaerae bacterium]|nr:UDP-3-O-acyl-N-acetylglucosamine deacetylase [Phycisphaerae bacterium]
MASDERPGLTDAKDPSGPARTGGTRLGLGAGAGVGPLASRGARPRSASDLSAAPRQRTLARSVTVHGMGLLIGADATCEICPAPPNEGIVFERVDVNPPVRIPATTDCTVHRPRRTTLKMGDVTIETVEHCLSAIRGLSIDNAIIRLSGPELPCGDGSAKPFTDPMLEVGTVAQDAPRRIYRLREPVVVEDEGGASISALPCDAEGMRVFYDLDYGRNAHRIRSQTFSYMLALAGTNGDYATEIAPARTFSLREEAEGLWAQGMCRHLTPKDVLVIGDNGPIDNAFRFEDECVRHKILDVIGDLTLVGCPVQCNILAIRSGHHLNRRLAAKIREQISATEMQQTMLDGRVMDIRAIQKLMPHRYPMLLVDRVIEMDGDKHAVGIKNVSINEPFFQGHYPGTPIMPGVLIVEAMAQLGGLLLSKTLEHQGKIAILLSLDRVKLRHPVTPGDQLVLEAENVRAKSRIGHLRCRALVGEKVAAEAEIRFMMVDADQA